MKRCLKYLPTYLLARFLDIYLTSFLIIFGLIDEKYYSEGKGYFSNFEWTKNITIIKALKLFDFGN